MSNNNAPFYIRRPLPRIVIASDNDAQQAPLTCPLAAQTRAPSHSERMDHAWNIVCGTHIDGREWSVSSKDTQEITGIGHVTIHRMRRAVRTMKAAGGHFTGMWSVDRVTAEALPRA